MSDQHQTGTAANESAAGEKFVWHPTYAGKSFERVRSDLVEDISRDQRQYKLAMDGAEGSEHDSLTTIVELERRWSTYDFDWAETDPHGLADRILRFEKEREARKEELSFADYRASGALVSEDTVAAPESTRSLPVMQIGVALLVILIVIFLIAILM